MLSVLSNFSPFLSAQHSTNFKDFILFTNMNKVQININCSAGYKIHRYIAPDKLRSVFFITEFIMYYRSYIFVLHDYRVGGHTTWLLDFFADQLVRPLGS